MAARRYCVGELGRIPRLWINKHLCGVAARYRCRWGPVAACYSTASIIRIQPSHLLHLLLSNTIPTSFYTTSVLEIRHSHRTMSSQPSNPVQLGPVESLLQCILTFLSATGKANRTRSHSSAAFISAKPVIGKFRLWARSFDTDCNLDRLLAEDAVLWETVILLLSSFIAGTAEAFGFCGVIH